MARIMPNLSIAEMKRLIERLEGAQELEEQIPQSYLDRLQRSADLLDQYRKLPVVDWDNLKNEDDVERAEGLIHQRLELKNEIEKHLSTCSLAVNAAKAKPGRRAAAGRKRAPRRSKAQLEYDRRYAEIVKAKKSELGLAPRGRLRPDDQEKLDKALERELKKQKLEPPTE